MPFFQWVTLCLVRRIRIFPHTPLSTCWAWGRRPRDRPRLPRGWCKVTTLTQVWSDPTIMLSLFQVKAPISRRCPPHRAVGPWPTPTPRHTSAARTPARPCIMWVTCSSSYHAKHRINGNLIFSPVGASLTREAPTCSCMTPPTATTSLQRTSSKTLATLTTVQRISTTEVWWAAWGTVRLRTTGDWADIIITWVTWSIIHLFSAHMAGKPQQQLLPGQIIAQQAAQQQQQKMMAQQQQQGAYGESTANTSNCVTLIYFPLYLRWIPPAPCRVQHWHSHLQGGASLSASQGRPAYCE